MRDAASERTPGRIGYDAQLRRHNEVLTRSRASAGLTRVVDHYERAGAGGPTAD